MYNLTEDDDHSKLVEMVLSGQCPYYMFKGISINLISSVENKHCKCLLALYCSFANLPNKSQKCQQLAVQYFDDLYQFILKQHVIPNQLKVFLASCLEFHLIPKPYIMSLSKLISYQLNDSIQSSPSLLNVLLSGSNSVAKVDLKPSTIQQYLIDNNYQFKHVGLVISKHICNPLEYQLDDVTKIILNGTFGNNKNLEPLIDAIDLDTNKTNQSEADNTLDLIIKLMNKLQIEFPIHLFVNKQWKHVQTQALYVLLLCTKELTLDIKKITEYTLEQLYHNEYHQKYIGLHYFPIFENCMILGTSYYPQLLENMIKSYTDLFLIGSIQFTEGYNLFSALIPQYLNHPFLVLLLSDSNAHPFMRTWLMELYKQSPLHLKHTLEALTNNSILQSFIVLATPPLQYDLVCWFNDQPDLWFKNQVFTLKDEAMRHLVDFIQSKSISANQSNEQEILLKLGPAAVVPLTVANTRAIKNVLSGYKGFELTHQTELFIQQAMEQLNHPAPTPSSDITTEARNLFSKLFRELYPPLQLVNVLKSHPQLQLKVVELLLQEKTYFQHYPQQELEIASEFLGHLCAQNSVPPSLMNECVLLLNHCIQQDPASKLFYFAHRVLLLCPSLLNGAIDASSIELPPDLKAHITPTAASTVQFTRPPIHPHPQLITINQTVLSPIEPQHTDKLSFIINNLSPSSLLLKSKEICALLKTNENYLFLAQYFIQRLCMESNFHSIYFDCIIHCCAILHSSSKHINPILSDTHLIEYIQHKHFTDHLLYKSTLFYALQQAQHQLTLTTTSGKNALKSIATFIGHLTLQQDIPLLHSMCHLPTLILSCQPLSILFVCKLLMSSLQSKVFTFSNPYIHYHCQLLLEVMRYGQLPSTLDIELLFKALKIDVSTLECTLLLPGRSKNVQQPPPQTSSSVEAVVDQGMQLAMKELLQPVVERSVVIASISTRELIAKDYPLPSLQKQQAAQHMIQHLSGALAMVTCKEPIRQSTLQYCHQQNLTNTNELIQLIDIKLQPLCDLITEQAKQQSLHQLDVNWQSQLMTSMSTVLPNAMQLQEHIYASFSSSPANLDLIQAGPQTTTPILELIQNTMEMQSVLSKCQHVNEQTLIEYTEYIVYQLYTTEEEHYAILLRELTEMHKSIMKVFTSWFYMCMDSKIINIKVLTHLMHVQLIRGCDIDTKICQIKPHKALVSELMKLEDINMLEMVYSCSYYSIPMVLVYQSKSDCFMKWTQLYTSSHWTEDTEDLFINTIINEESDILHFMRTALELTIDHHQSGDALMHLMSRLIKANKTSFEKMMSLMGMIVIHYHEGNGTLPVKQLTKLWSLFLTMLINMNSSGLAEELKTVLHVLQPQCVPGFAFGWLCLMSHRHVLVYLIKHEHYSVLLVDLLYFLKSFTSQMKMTEATRLLYKGTLRLMLVLLHDYPEFLCLHYYTLYREIPSSCIQLKNLLLSCFPRDLRLPDPFTPGLEMSNLAECTQRPRIEFDSQKEFKRVGLSLQECLLVVQHPTHHNIGSITNCLVENETGIHAFVLGIVMDWEPHMSLYIDFYELLLNSMDNKHRVLVLGSMVNHLRYPNAHSLFYNKVLLGLFERPSISEEIRELITRVLLERLIANRPHPWCLLTTFVALIKDPRYGFWSHSFTKCAPDIERLFESVARSIS